jgi:hypothetical protein
MAEGYVDENGVIRWGERHDFGERAVPPGREDDGDDHGDEDGDEDGDDEPEGDED